MKVYDFLKEQKPAEEKRKFSRAEIEAFDREGWSCHYCGSKRQLTTDHRVARRHGGTDDAENLLPSCRRCNSMKGKKSYDDFLEWLYAERAAFAAYLETRDCQ